MSRWRYALPLACVAINIAVMLAWPQWWTAALLLLTAFAAGADVAVVTLRRSLHDDEVTVTATSLIARQLLLTRSIPEYQWQVRPGEFLPVDETEALRHHDAGGEIRVRLHTQWARLKG